MVMSALGIGRHSAPASFAGGVPAPPIPLWYQLALALAVVCARALG